MGRGDFKPLNRRGTVLTTPVTDPTPSTIREGRPKLLNSILGRPEEEVDGLLQPSVDPSGLQSLPGVTTATSGGPFWRGGLRLSLVAAAWWGLDNTLK